MDTVTAWAITGSWTNLNALVGITSGTAIRLQNVSRSPGAVIELAISTTEPDLGFRGRMLEQLTRELEIAPGENTVWVRAIKARLIAKSGVTVRLSVEIQQGGIGGAQPSNFISILNSTSIPLESSGVFTGPAEDVSNFTGISVLFDSNVSGTVSMEFSVDGINWDRQKVVPLTISIGSGSTHTLRVISQYFRVVFTNGSVGQSHFRLQTIYKPTSGFLSSNVDQIISSINDAQIVRVASEVGLDLARGLYADKFGSHNFGFNDAVPNGTFADIWAYGPTDPTYNWPVTTEKFRVATGGNSGDTVGGAGARTIQVIYLDALGTLQQDQLTLAGALVSDSTVLTGRRMLRAWVDSTGSILSNNIGGITIENETSGDIVGFIPAGFGETQLSQFTVPLGFTCYLKNIHVDVSTGANKDADIRFWQRQGAYDDAAPFGTKRIIRQWTAVQNDNNINYGGLPRFPALTDLWFEGKGNNTATSVNVDYDVVCIKNEAPTIPQNF